MPEPAHLLIIDDMSLNRDVLESSLGSDHDIQCVTSVEQALARVREQAPDLILLDVITDCP